MAQLSAEISIPPLYLTWAIFFSFSCLDVNSPLYKEGWQPLFDELLCIWMSHSFLGTVDCFPLLLSNLAIVSYAILSRMWKNLCQFYPLGCWRDPVLPTEGKTGSREQVSLCPSLHIMFCLQTHSDPGELCSSFSTPLKHPFLKWNFSNPFPGWNLSSLHLHLYCVLHSSTVDLRY